MAALEKLSNKENVNEQIDSLLRAIDEKKQNLQKLQSATVELMSKSQSMADGSGGATDSRAAYALSLYSKISNITWDSNAADGKIAGCE